VARYQTDDQSQPENDQNNGKDVALATMEARIESLETQLATKDQQIDQLHYLLAQTALNTPPARRTKINRARHATTPSSRDHAESYATLAFGAP